MGASSAEITPPASSGSKDQIQSSGSHIPGFKELSSSTQNYTCTPDSGGPVLELPTNAGEKKPKKRAEFVQHVEDRTDDAPLLQQERAHGP
ncbi:hypothetical protein SRHO_G00115170 [Serrasalmus rhombeus]